MVDETLASANPATDDLTATATPAVQTEADATDAQATDASAAAAAAMEPAAFSTPDASPAPRKPSLRQPAPRAPAAKAPTRKISPAKVTTPRKTIKARPAVQASRPADPSLSQLKDKIMATKSTDFTGTDFLSGFAGMFNPAGFTPASFMPASFTPTAFTEAVAEAQAKAKAAFEQGSAAVGEAGEFAKGNVEAMVESGKILTEGLKDLGSTLVSEGKAAIETLTADAKELSGLKSPNDFFKMQGDLMRRNFDSMVAFGSKNTEAMMKLAGDVSSPLSSRVSLAMEKFKTAA